jgi:hypothetical protein
MSKQPVKIIPEDTPISQRDIDSGQMVLHKRSSDGTVKLPSFIFYSPYITFSNPLNYQFLDYRGRPVVDSKAGDARALYLLGKEIFNLTPHVASMQEFDDVIPYYEDLIESLRAQILKVESAGLLQLVDKVTGGEIKVDWTHADWGQILEVARQINLKDDEQAEPFVKDFFEELFLIYALKKIDDCLLHAIHNQPGGISEAIEANIGLMNAKSIRSGGDALASARKIFARLGAKGKKNKDPKQREKQLVKERWETWQQKPDQYKGQAVFARDMIEKSPIDNEGKHILKSTNVIERWCREWKKELKKR